MAIESQTVDNTGITITTVHGIYTISTSQILALAQANHLDVTATGNAIFAMIQASPVGQDIDMTGLFIDVDPTTGIVDCVTEGPPGAGGFTFSLPGTFVSPFTAS